MPSMANCWQQNRLAYPESVTFYARSMREKEKLLLDTVERDFRAFFGFGVGLMEKASTIKEEGRIYRAAPADSTLPC